MNKNNKKTVRPTIWADTLDKIEKLGSFYNIKDIKLVLDKIVDEHLKFDNKLNENINSVCNNNLNRQELLLPIITNYINKTLKGYGVVKEKHKKSVKAEDELLRALKEMVKYYDKLPLESRKYVTPSMVQKYLIINHDKYKQKHPNVIKRLLMSEQVDFIKQYHERNNLTFDSNKKGKTNE